MSETPVKVERVLKQRELASALERVRLLERARFEAAAEAQRLSDSLRRAQANEESKT